MHEHNNNNFSISRQATARAASVLSAKQIEMMHELVQLYSQPDTPERRNRIAQWWVQTEMRVCDEDAIFFQQLKAELFSEGGAS